MNIIFIGLVVVTLVILTFIASRYKKVKAQGWALVVNGPKKSRATLTGTFIWPVIDQAVDVCVTDRKVTIERIGRPDGYREGDELRRGLSCACGVRANIVAAFYISFPTENMNEIIKLTSKITPRIINNDDLLREYLAPIFNEALKTCVSKLEYEKLITDRNSFADAVMEELNEGLHGLNLYKVAIEEVQHSSVDSHDPDDLYDSIGIVKITNSTSTKMIEKTVIDEKRLSDIKSKQFDGFKVREGLDIEEHNIREHNASLKEIKTSEQKRLSEIQRYKDEVEQERARLDKERIVAEEMENNRASIEQAQVDVDRKVNLSRVNSDKEVSLFQEEAELEKVKKSAFTRVAEEQSILEQADIKAKRVEIERGIAVQEEETHDLRTARKVHRTKTESVGEAEARAEAIATERRILSSTELTISEQDNERRRKMAEADLTIEESKAKAIERMAAARIEEESAAGLAEARTSEAMGIANAKVKQEDAKAEEAMGLAKANSEKAIREAMEVDPSVREHELAIALQGIISELMEKDIQSRQAVGIAQADALGKAYASADIKIFGGQDGFAENIMGQYAQTENMKANPMLNNLISQYEDGERSVADDVKDVMGKSSASDLMNLSMIQKMNTGDIGALLAGLLNQSKGNPQNTNQQ